MAQNRYLEYLKAVAKPFNKLARLEFLNPDNSIAFVLDNKHKRGYNRRYDTRAFLEEGTMSVNLSNGQRRTAGLTIANADGAFDYAVNNLWFGQRVRLSMGLVLPDGSDFYLPQGVFYLKEPTNDYKPNSRVISYNLVDKWAYLDGTLFGNLDVAYIIPKGGSGSEATNIFEAMKSVLRLSRYTLGSTDDKLQMVDNVEPIFTDYYNGVVVGDSGETMAQLGYEVRVEAGGHLADILLELNEMVAGWIAYDATGALRVEPSQDDLNDSDKPILWSFSERDKNFLGLSETAKNTAVYNNVLIVGESLNGGEIVGQAQNLNPQSDTNINLIGLRTYREQKASFWNETQCKDLAEWTLKRKTVLQKSVALEASQMFHLQENGLIAVRRFDKEGSPLEKHLIEGFTLPIGETGAMTINAVSVNDLQFA